MPTLSTIGLIADIIGILGAIFALFAWLQSRALKKELDAEKERQNKRVNVSLQHGSQKIDLPIQLRRAELTRSEILGRIGMIPMKEEGKRFSISFLYSEDFLKQINQIMEGTGESILVIPCTEKEFKQFKL